MIVRARSNDTRVWHRLYRRAAVLSIALYGLGWPTFASAATPAWWDCNYGYRKQITVSAGSAVSAGHSVSLTFNHASLVSAGKAMSNGNDVRVLYWNGSTWTELARGPDPGSAGWNNSATKIWFKLQAAIPSSSSDANYYLYYGNPSAGTPTWTWSDVLIFYDGFESGNLTAWSGSANTAGDSIAASPDAVGQNGTYSGKAVTDTTPDPVLGYSYGFVWKNITGQNTLYAKLNVYVPSSFSAGTNDVVIMEFLNGWSNIISLTINAEDRTLFMWKEGGPPAGPFGYGDPPSTELLIGWNTIEMMATASTTSGEARVWLNGSLEIEATGQNLGSNPIDKVAAGVYYSIPEDKANTIYIDDVIVRSWVGSEPTTSLGTELAQDCPPPTGFSPCYYQYRKKITVTNNDSIQLGGNTIAAFTADTQNLIGAGKVRSDGKDWRIVYWNGTAHVEIAQLVKSGWNTASTATWFRLQAAINAGANDGNYYVYYGYAGETGNPTAFTTTEQLLESYATGDNQGNEAIDFDSTEWGAAQGVQFNAGTSRYWEITRFRFYKNQGPASSSQVAGFIFTATGQLEGSQITNGKSNAYASNTFGSGLNDLGWGSSKPRVKTGNQYYIAILPTTPAGRAPSPNPNPSGYFRWDYHDGATGGYRSTCTNCKGYGIRQSGTWAFDNIADGADRRFEVYGTEASNTDLSSVLGSEETVGTVVSYFTPDAAAAGMNIPVTFVGSICQVPTVTTNSSDIIIGPVIMTDGTGAVVTALGKAASTVFFLKPNARPATGITVTVDGKLLSQTFDIVMPTPDPNVTSGTVSLTGPTKRGTKVLGGLTVSGGTLTIDTSDTDGGTVGNQGYLPAVILVKGDVNIAGTVDVKGQNGTNGGNCTGGGGGAGGPGGGGGGGGGVEDGTCGGSGGTLDIKVSTSSDDAEQCLSNSAMDLSSGDLELIADGNCSGSNQQVGIRFQNMTIPQGASITSSYIEFTAETPRSGTTNLTFYGQAIDNAPTFTLTAGNITSRTKTSASVAWNSVPAWNTDGEKKQTPDLSTVISEIVNRAGWASGNSLVIIVTGTSGSNREAYSYNGSSANAPLLHVVYNQGAPSSAAAGGVGRSGGGGGGSKGTGTGAAGGDGTAAIGAAASGTTGGAGGAALPGAGGGGGGMANTEVAGGDGGGGGTGDPSGVGGSGAATDGALGGQGGGGGGASGTTPGGGGGGAFATAGARGPDVPDAGYGGNVTGNAQLVPLAGGSGGAGGGPDTDDASAVNRGGGGGGGGGAVQIYATGSLTVSGTITAVGGNGGNGTTSGSNGSGGGGGGSGGAILLQSSNVTATGTLTTAGGTAGTSGSTNGAGGAGGTGRIRIDGLNSGSTVPGTAGSKSIGPVIDTLVDTTVKGRADGGSTVTLYVYDSTGAQVSGSPYTASAGGSTGSVGTWTINNVTFPSGTGFLAVKQTTGSAQVLGPGRATKGLHLTNWREVY